jgi:hypothetical protein
MNQLDREFIVTTVKASEKELKTFIVSFVTEHVSEEINALAFVTAKGFERVDKRIDDFQDNMNARLEGVNRRIDKIDVNMVKIEDFARLEKRVSKLEKVSA